MGGITSVPRRPRPLTISATRSITPRTLGWPGVQLPPGFLFPVRAVTDDTKFSRSDEGHFLGKCDERIEVPVPTQLKDDLAVAAHFRSMSSAQLAREILSDWLYGRVAAVKRVLNR